MSLTDDLALVLSAAGIVVGALGVAVTRKLRAGFPITVELWTAAGLIRLAGDPEWSTIATAAALIAMRRLTSVSLGAGPWWAPSVAPR